MASRRKQRKKRAKDEQRKQRREERASENHVRQLETNKLVRVVMSSISVDSEAAREAYERRVLSKLRNF